MSVKRAIQRPYTSAGVSMEINETPAQSAAVPSVAGLLKA